MKNDAENATNLSSVTQLNTPLLAFRENITLSATAAAFLRDFFDASQPEQVTLLSALASQIFDKDQPQWTPATRVYAAQLELAAFFLLDAPSAAHQRFLLRFEALLRVCKKTQQNLEYTATTVPDLLSLFGYTQLLNAIAVYCRPATFRLLYSRMSQSSTGFLLQYHSQSAQWTRGDTDCYLPIFLKAQNMATSRYLLRSLPMTQRRFDDCLLEAIRAENTKFLGELIAKYPKLRIQLSADMIDELAQQTSCDCVRLLLLQSHEALIDAANPLQVSAPARKRASAPLQLLEISCFGVELRASREVTDALWQHRRILRSLRLDFKHWSIILASPAFRASVSHCIGEPEAYRQLIRSLLKQQNLKNRFVRV